MNRGSRSNVFVANQANDENTSQLMGKQGARYNTRKSSRTALGDISNRVRMADGSKKMKVDEVKKPKSYRHDYDMTSKVTSNQSSKSSMMYKKSSVSTRQQEKMVAASINLDDSDIKTTDMETTLDDSVAALCLSSIDAEDADNPQMVTDYIQDIMAYFRRSEGRRAPSPNYMSKQTDINAKMREILIDWLVEVHLKFKLREETLHLTVNIIDRFLERRAVSRTKLQLVGCTAMLIASKYEEIYAPEVRDFVYISDKAYTREQILAMESIMLNTLEFNLTVPSAHRFAQRFTKVASASPTLTNLTKYFIDLTLQDYKFLKYLPSTIAAGALYMALHTTKENSWNSTIQSHTQYAPAALRDIVNDLYAVAAIDSPKYRAVRKKYSHKKYLEVASIKVSRPMM